MTWVVIGVLASGATAGSVMVHLLYRQDTFSRRWWRWVAADAVLYLAFIAATVAMLILIS